MQTRRPAICFARDPALGGKCELAGCSDEHLDTNDPSARARCSRAVGGGGRHGRRLAPPPIADRLLLAACPWPLVGDAPYWPPTTAPAHYSSHAISRIRLTADSRPPTDRLPLGARDDSQPTPGRPLLIAYRPPAARPRPTDPHPRPPPPSSRPLGGRSSSTSALLQSPLASSASAPIPSSPPNPFTERREREREISPAADL